MRLLTPARRRSAVAAIALVTATAFGAGVVAAPAAVAAPGDAVSYGLHVPQIANGLVPSVPTGTIRLWDVGISWGKVQPSEKKFWWTGMDKAIANSNKLNAKILYVLGSTPTWAAKNKKQGTYPNKGAASMPSSMKLWKDWVTAVTKRYAASIDAYQIWNEANLQTFWMGTPDQMADLTNEAYKIIRKNDPTAQIVSASSTVRLTSAYDKFFPAYLKGLKTRGWPVTAYSVHLYPNSLGTPADRVGYISTVRASLAAAGAPAKPLWDTEVNYGLAGPGASNPKVNIDGDQAAAWVSQTYLDSARLGIDRTYWYSFTPTPYSLLGIQMIPGSAGSLGYATTYGWMVGGSVTCATAAVNTCTIVKNGATSTVAWASTGSGSFVVPAGATNSVTAMNVSTPVTAGQSVTIGSMPTWFGAS
jgi:hypothetical protein